MKIDNNTKIAFLGGDMRAATAALKLSDMSWDVFAWSVPERKDAYRVCYCSSINEAVSGAKAIILPLPASLDGISLNQKLREDEQKTELKTIVDMADSGCIMIGGKLSGGFSEYASDKGIKTYDYFCSESFQIKNAYTTAEAALNIAMNNLSKNIKGADFAITGYGRIAKQLARLLCAMGGNVTVAARKESDRALAELEGCKTFKLGSQPISMLSTGYDIIFNTVPQLIFDEGFLHRAASKTIFVELASAPGGFDVSVAKKLRTNVLWAASLPGKYAPESAGELIAACIQNVLESEVGRC